MSANDKPRPGYAFIPLSGHVDRRPRPHARHDKHVDDTLSGTLLLTWVAEQPIHIGSGFKSLERGVVRQAVRLGDVLCIPGSTLKGALRARYSAITCSCAAAPRHSEMSIRSSTYGSRGVRRARILPSALRHDAFGRCTLAGACPTCALFGQLALRSRLVVTDALPDNLSRASARIPPQFGPNLHHVGHFDLNTERKTLDLDGLHGRKFAVGRDERPPPPGCRPTDSLPKQDIEVIREGSRLSSEVRFLNLTPPELGGLIAALGFAPRSRLKIGGGKSQGLGRLRLEALDPWFRHPRTQPPELAAFEAIFRRDPSCDQSNLDRLAQLHGEDC